MKSRLHQTRTKPPALVSRCNGERTEPKTSPIAIAIDGDRTEQDMADG